MAYLVRELMSKDPVTLDEDQDLSLAETIMSLGRIRHLPVVRDGRLVGLVSHRDLLRVQASTLDGLSFEERERQARRVTAAEVMVRDVRSVAPDTPVLEAARLIHKHKLGCLPVVEGRRLVGIVTEADFLGVVIQALEREERGA